MNLHGIPAVIAIGVLMGLTQSLHAQAGGTDGTGTDAREVQDQQANEVTRSGAAWSWERYGGVFGSTQYEVSGLVELVQVDDAQYEIQTNGIQVSESGRYSLYASSRTPSKVDTKKKPRDTKLGSIGTRSGNKAWTLETDVAESLRSLIIWDDEESRVAGILALTEGRVIAHSHTWGKAQKKTTGGWEIVRREDGVFFRTSPDFKTARPPEPLGVLLTSTNSSRVTKKNAERGSLKVATLRSHEGAQEVRLPDDVDIAEFATVVLWCKPYKVVFGVSSVDAVEE